ncbi:Protein CFT1 [Leucoagaricus sp. SymC.cos]|nr:Protein CFT1 [Leucoagaricus sp. SymC.cos]
MHALQQEILPASGVEFATSLKLLPSTIHDLPASPTASVRHEIAARVLCNVVVARSNILRIFEVREEPAPVPTQTDDERERKGKARRGTEAVEGESVAQKSSKHPTVTKFYFIREHRLHGIVTGMEGVRIMASLEDKLDRLLVSFKDAKIALLEWSDTAHDLITVSIHTYERAPQLLSLDSPLFRADLRVDPQSRCAALSLPKHAIAILPFYQTQAELDVMEQDQPQLKDVPYSPSFILDLPIQVEENIRNVIDFVFLPGFNNPTIAILFQTQQTWTGRLREFKDTVHVIIFTLDIMTQNSTIITSVSNLPHDAFSLLPCSTAFGGVIILASNSVIYIDQASRRVGLQVNNWASRISDLTYPPLVSSTANPGGGEQGNLTLEGCRSIMIDDKTLFLIHRDGTVYPVELIADGKTVSKLNIGDALARTTIPTVVKRVDEEHVFIGSVVGPSILLKIAHVEQEIQEGEDVRTLMRLMCVDIYGDSKIEVEPTTNGTMHVKKTKTVIQLSLRDYLPSYGPISSMTFSLAMNGEKPVPELVAATGSGSLGGFTLFQRDLPVRKKRKILTISGSRGIWSLPIRQPLRNNSTAYGGQDNDTLILSTDINPSPGSSRIATRSPNRDISIKTRTPGLTIGASPFFQRTAILHVMTNAIRVLEPDGTERQIIPDKDGNMPRAKIRACSICDPFVLVVREDDSIGLFIGEMERGKIRRKDMSPMGDKSSRYLGGCFFSDTTGLFEAQFENKLPPSATSTIQAASGGKSQWLLLIRPQGVLEIWTLPKLLLAFSTSGISSLQSVLTDSHDPPAVSLPQDPPRKPQELDIEQVLLAPIGENSLVPCLCIFLRSGQLAIYEAAALTQPPSDTTSTTTRSTTLKLKFVKSLSKSFEISRLEESEKSHILAEQKKVNRLFIPFTTSPVPGMSYSGVFFTGDNPSWILSTDRGGVKVFGAGYSVVHAFTSCSVWESRGEFLMYTEEGPILLEWIPDFQYDNALPTRSVPRGRAYSSVLFDPSTSLIVAASSLQARFISFDEDGNKLWEPDAPNLPEPSVDCSALELIAPDIWVTMDG